MINLPIHIPPIWRLIDMVLLSGGYRVCDSDVLKWRHLAPEAAVVLIWNSKN